MISRRAIGATLAAALATPSAAHAQPTAKAWRIGFLGVSRSASPKFIGSFEQGLSERGYVIGKTVVIEHRWDGSAAGLAADAAELVQLGVDVLVAGTSIRALAARHATATIPIVMVNVGDPVGIGLVASLGRPGGNVTGLSRQTEDLVGKSLQLLKEAAPIASRVAVLWSSAEPTGPTYVERARSAAAALDMQIVPASATALDDLDAAFSRFADERANSLFVPSTSVLYSFQQRIALLALQGRLPSIYNNTEFVNVGGLMSYGPNSFEPYRRAASYVDKILRGARPADLPVEQPTKFELVINAKTAKALGLAIPHSLLLRADEVIE